LAGDILLDTSKLERATGAIEDQVFRLSKSCLAVAPGGFASMRKTIWRVGVLLIATFAVAEAATLAAPMSASRGRRPYGTISGTVLDSRGNPLAGALVKVLKDGVGQVVSESTSSEDGSFIARVAPGRYLLSALAKGFNPATFTAVDVGASSELVYRFNLQPAGEGRTTAERRSDRNDPKFKLRSQQARRSVFHAKEGGDDTVEAAIAQIEEEEAAASRGVGDGLSTGDDSENRGQTRPQGFVETYFASSADPRVGGYTGLNFAVATPITRDFDLIFAGQLGEFERLEATARFNAGARHRVTATFGGARLPLAPKSVERLGAERLDQLSVRAVDEWIVRDGIVVVLGVDYSRFFGPSHADSVTPRFGVAYDVDARTRVRAAYTSGRDSAASVQTFDLEDGPVVFREMPAEAVALVDGHAVMERSRRLEFGLERVLSEASSVEVSAFFDTVDNRGVGLLSSPLGELSEAGNAALLDIANQQGGARGVRVVYTRRVSHHLTASAGYAFGHGQQLSPDGITSPGQLFRGSLFQTAAAQLEANLLDGTNVLTVLRFSPRAAVFAIDPFAGRLAVYDPSLSILVTQDLPSFGLPLRAQATIDARNLFDVLTGVEDGESTLSVNVLRRTLRGGISVRF
jgi:hypothetical protein